MGLRILLFLALLAPALAANAAEVAGVEVPAQISTPDGEALSLNGAGIRSKFFIKVYVGALYLPQPEDNAAAMLQHRGPVAMHLHILHSEISQQKLIDAWTDGFEDNLSRSELATLGPRIQKFNGLFSTVREGDTIALRYQPDSGTEVRINDQVRGLIPGEDFMHAWLRIWLGDRPADQGLKRALLDNR